MKKVNSGRLIVFEGIDGTGKTTQIQMLADYLVQKGYTVTQTREPTDGIYGKKIRALYCNRENSTPEEELQLFINDRREHVKSVIEPALAKGHIVLCDRYYLSTAAYQGANGFDPNDIIQKNAFAPEPDIALVFEQPIETSLARITQGRGEVLNDFEQAESLKRVSMIFSQLDLPCIRRIRSDDSIENTHERVVDVITELLDKG